MKVQPVCRSFFSEDEKRKDQLVIYPARKLSANRQKHKILEYLQDGDLVIYNRYGRILRIEQEFCESRCV